MNKPAAVFSICGALLAASLVFFRQNLAGAPAMQNDAAVVRVSRADLGAVVKATGVIRPCVGAEVRVGSRASGVVQRLYVKVGDTVEKGQLLAELDDRDLQARRDQALAEVRRSQAELRYAQNELKRKAELSAARVATPSELDSAERNGAVAEQQVALARASLTSAETQLSYARIVAPISGVVASVSTQEGETVSASLEAPTFVTLIDLERLEVRAYVDETDIGRIKAGQGARFTVDTYGDEEFEGAVATIYPKAEIRDNVVDYVTVVKFNPPRDRILRPEMTTTVRIALDARQHVLVLPLRALRSAGGQTYVVVRKGGEAKQCNVTVGMRSEGRCEIISGVSEGDEVVLSGELSQGEPKP
jgi:RND family efflux transporter MFP subunit